MTKISYFGKHNSTLGSVVPLAMFGNVFGFNVMDSYFSLLNLSFVENYHISIFTTFEKQSIIN